MCMANKLGILGVVQIVLIVLKLTNLIAWSWMAVLTPLWIEIFLLIVIALYYSMEG